MRQQICECGSEKFRYVKKHMGGIDYVPAVSFQRGLLNKDIRAIACQDCGLVLSMLNENGKVFQRKDILDYFRGRYKNVDRNEQIKKIYQHRL